MKCTLILALIPTFALANGGPPAPPVTVKDPSANATAAATSISGAAASSKAESASKSSATATQTQQQTQVASGGKATSSAAGGSANNAGNVQGVTINESNPRNAPSLGQGSTYIGSCGAGGNAGGSGVNGAGFLGLSWTPADCKLLLAADAYRSLGMVDAACQMVNRISTVQKAWRDLGMDAPDCQARPTVSIIPVPALPAVDASKYATHEEVEAAFKRSVTK